MAKILQAGDLTNTATIAGDQADTNTTNNQVNATVTGVANADLAVTKTVNHAIQFVGKKVIYTITATNKGPSDATGVTVTDLLPTGLKFVWASSTNYNPSTDTWTIGNLANGATATLNIVAKILHPGIFINTATIKGGQADLTPGNNLASATVIGVKKPKKHHNEPKKHHCKPCKMKHHREPVRIHRESYPVTELVTAVETVPMQATGIPIAAGLLGALMVVAGLILPRKR